VIEHTTSPFALVDENQSEPHDGISTIGNTIAIYKYSAWCDTHQRIPASLSIKALPAHLTDLPKNSTGTVHDFPLLEVSVTVKQKAA
jgi:hypothetical protein